MLKNSLTCCLYFFLFVCTYALAENASPRKIVNVNDGVAVQAAQYFLEQLRQTSDSGIYETLDLNSIIYAATQDGVFHENVHLSLALASPYFKSGQNIEAFEVVVMTHLQDRSRSFAIDRFPEMDEDAIELFWIQKVEAHRQMREELFQQMLKDAPDSEIETELTKSSQYNPSTSEKAENIEVQVSPEGSTQQTVVTSLEEEYNLKVLMEELPVADLVHILQQASEHPTAAKVAGSLLEEKYSKTLSEKFQIDILELSKLTINELYSIMTQQNNDLVSNQNQKKIAEMLINFKLQVMTTD